MKKSIISFVVMGMMAVTASFAQSSLVATLDHNGTITTFYDVTALQQAYEAAVSGDVITLSSGSFNSVNIEKGITLRGAGMSSDPLVKALPTILIGDFDINIESSEPNGLIMEGIYTNYDTRYINLYNCQFIRCRFYRIYYTNGATSSYIHNTTFVHCKIIGTLSLPSNSLLSLFNCVVSPSNSGSDTSNFHFTNCIIIRDNINSDLKYAYVSNSIIISTYKADSHSTTATHASCTVWNCIGLSLYDTNMFANSTNTTNTSIAGENRYTSIFKTYTGGSIDIDTFELTDEAKTTYLGNDGTEVGIYGGTMPFVSTPSYPIITKCEVADKTTADGKLNVSIEVKNAD